MGHYIASVQLQRKKYKKYKTKLFLAPYSVKVEKRKLLNVVPLDAIVVVWIFFFGSWFGSSKHSFEGNKTKRTNITLSARFHGTSY